MSEHIDSPSTWADAIDWARRQRFADLAIAADLLRTGLVEETDDLERLENIVLDRFPSGVEMTLQRLHQYAVTGPRPLVEDPDNAHDWADLAHRLEAAGEDPEDVIGALLDAGRGPAYGRDALAVMRRHGATFDDLDLTRPTSEISDRLEHGLTPAELDGWAQYGITDPDRIIGLRDRGVTLAKATLLERAEVAPHDWEAYGSVPERWLTLYSHDRDAGWTMRQVIARAIPLDEHLTTPGERGNAYRTPPWRTKAGVLTPEQVQQVAETARFRASTVSRYIDAMVPNTRTQNVHGAPPRFGLTDDALLFRYRHPDNKPVNQALLDAMVALHEAGVRPSHLTDYRWAGCHTAEQILDAVRDLGVDGAAAKNLRALYGRSAWRGAPKRIEDYDALTDAVVAARAHQEAQ